jgi:hypothetical protein
MAAELTWPATEGRTNERLAIHVEPFVIPALTCPLVASMNHIAQVAGSPGKHDAANRGLKPILTA